MRKCLSMFLLLLTILFIVGCSNKEENTVAETTEFETNATTAAVLETTMQPTELNETDNPEGDNLEKKQVLAYSIVDGTETFYYYDSEERLVYEESPKWGSSIEYIYGEGNILLQKKEHRFGDYITEYDLHGNPEKCYRMNDGSQGKELIYQYANAYNDAGQITEIIQEYLENGVVYRKDVFHYDYLVDGGYSVEQKQYTVFSDTDVSLSDHTITYYNVLNQPLEEITYWSDGSSETVISEYDEHGNVEIRYRKHCYVDEAENRIEFSFFKNTYNDAGQLIQVAQEICYGDNIDEIRQKGQTTVDNLIEYDYDDEGNLTVVRFTYTASDLVKENIYRYVPVSEALYGEAGVMENNLPIPETVTPTEMEQSFSAQVDTTSWLDTIDDEELVWKIASLMEKLLKNNPDVYEARVLLPEGAATQEAYGGSRFLKLDNVQVNGYWIETAGLSFSADCTANTVTFFIWTEAGSTDIGWVYDWDGNLIRDYDGQTLSDYVLGVFEQD